MKTFIQKSNILFFILSFAIIVSIHFTSAAFTPPSGTAPYATPAPMDTSTVSNIKTGGLSVKGLLSGTSGFVAINSNGNVGVNTGGTVSNFVRVEVGGAIINSSLAGTGTGNVCTSSSGSSTDGYTLTRC